MYNYHSPGFYETYTKILPPSPDFLDVQLYWDYKKIWIFAIFQTNTKLWARNGFEIIKKQNNQFFLIPCSLHIVGFNLHFHISAATPKWIFLLTFYCIIMFPICLSQRI